MSVFLKHDYFLLNFLKTGKAVTYAPLTSRQDKWVSLLDKFISQACLL